MIAAPTAARIHATGFTAAHSRLRRVAGSDLSYRICSLKRSLPWCGGSRWCGSAIGMPHEAPTSRLIRLASSRRATRAPGARNRPMPGPGGERDEGSPHAE